MPPPKPTEITPQRQQKNLRRRTVDSGLMNGEPRDVVAASSFVTPSRTRGKTSTDNAEPASLPGKNKRRSLGATGTPNSPFQAGSLRNPSFPQSGSRSLPRLRSNRMTDSTVDGELSGSDDASFMDVEVLSAGVNTTQSLHDMVDSKIPLKFGDLRSKPGKSKQQTSALGESCNCSRLLCGRLAVIGADFLIFLYVYMFYMYLCC